MRKNIDIDDNVLKKLKFLSAVEEISVKKLMEKAISFFVESKEKEDLGLLLLMQQSDRNDIVSEEEIMKELS